jgi:hypothetical protein
MILVKKLDEYQEQPYLLDPFLSKMVEPVVEELKNVIRSVVEQDEISLEKAARLHQLSTLVYWYSKTRGTKAIGERMRVIISNPFIMNCIYISSILSTHRTGPASCSEIR